MSDMDTRERLQEHVDGAWEDARAWAELIESGAWIVPVFMPIVYGDGAW